MKLTKLSIVALLALLCAGFTACSETEEPSEFANWQPRNTEWLTQIADSAKNNLTDETQRTAGKWLILKNISLSPDQSTPTITQANMKDYVYVKILSSGTSQNRPLATDTVRVDYRGFLMPTSSYPKGYVFDQSYEREYDEATNQPRELSVKGVVSGWQTALQHMRIGDRWILYIPQELAYGTEASGSIPAYSTLKFDLHLDGVRRLGGKEWLTE